MAAIRAACSACVPCEAFNRNTSTPASSNCRSTASESLAGPSVATILVLGIKSGTIPFCLNMPVYQVIVLAIVQGLTEFLPISSTAHLYLTSWLLGWHAESLTFDIALHIGTLLAVLVYFFRDWLQIIAHGFGMRYGRDEELDRNRALLWLLAIGSIPVGAAGLLFNKQA